MTMNRNRKVFIIIICNQILEIVFAIDKYTHNFIKNIMFYTEFITLFLIISMRKISMIRCVYGIYMQKIEIFIYNTVVLLIYFINKPKVIYEEPIIELFDKNTEETEIIEENYVIEIKSVFVDVKGAVKNPGVYELLETNRVIDAINLSGGVLENADTNNINLSKRLKDEMVIIVDFKKEVMKEEITCPTIKEEKQVKEEPQIENNNEKEEIYYRFGMSHFISRTQYHLGITNCIRSSYLIP